MPKETSRFAAEAHLIAKANKDKAFRRRLLKNPKATIAKELKVKFASGAQVTVIEETPKTWHMVIPKGAAKKEPMVLVRDRGGIFYKVPRGTISIFAVRDKKELKKAALSWKAETPEVEGQEWWELWRHPWHNPSPSCSIRG
jgi:hypothetical protein